MRLGLVLKDLILGFSMFTVGIALYLVWVHAEEAVHHVRWAASHAYMKAGYAIVVTLIAESVYHAPFIPASWRVWLYLVGLGLAGIGLLGLAREHRARPPWGVERRNGG